MERGQLDQQHLDLLVPCLSEQFLHAFEALGLWCEAEPIDRSPSEVETEPRAAIATTVDGTGSRGVVVNQYRDIAGASG